MKKYKYPIRVKVEIGKKKITFITQLYQVGLYLAIYEGGNPVPDQIITDPPEFSNRIKNVIKSLKAEGNKVEVGREVTAYKDKEGFWKEEKIWN